jgi:hypothetical protein
MKMTFEQALKAPRSEARDQVINERLAWVHQNQIDEKARRDAHDEYYRLKNGA